MKVLSLSGKMAIGKTTLANIVSSRVDDQTLVKYNFGDLLKRECADVFGFDLGLAYSQPGKNTKIFHPDLPKGQMVVREILQWWGSDVRRKQNKDYWVCEMERFCSMVNADILVIDDVRFPNEADFGKEKGMLARIHPHEKWQPGPYANHISETALDSYTNWDLEITPHFGKQEQAGLYIYNCFENFVNVPESRELCGNCFESSYSPGCELRG